MSQTRGRWEAIRKVTNLTRDLLSERYPGNLQVNVREYAKCTCLHLRAEAEVRNTVGKLLNPYKKKKCICRGGTHGGNKEAWNPTPWT